VLLPSQPLWGMHCLIWVDLAGDQRAPSDLLPILRNSSLLGQRLLAYLIGQRTVGQSPRQRRSGLN